MKCSKCKFDNPEGAKFCIECGQNFGEKVARRAELAIEGERKQVTVLFSDLSGYTAMTEKLDPEEVKEIMGRVFGEISQVVTRYEGFIEKFVGDAVMAMFGAVTAHEDDPVRAIRAAKEIHEVVSSISPRYEKRIGRPLNMHTGICTGLVVTENVNIENGTHGVLGDAINVAFRLSGLAKTGEIVVGSDTYHQTEGHFTFEPLEATHVKGRTEAVKPYKVISPRGEPTKTHRISGLRAELIGRKVEMTLLQESLQNLKQGKGAIFSIVGDAGTGKSRLIEEFKLTINPEEVQWREGHAYAYSQNIPYYPVVDLLNRAWQIHEAGSIEQIRQAVETGARSRLGNRDDLIPYVGSLYSLKYLEIESVGPEIWKSRLHEALRLILEDLCQKALAIICVEDLHWADSSSVEFLRLILKDFQLPAVFLFAYRPPFNLFPPHQLASLSNAYNEIKLQELSTSEAQTMAESLLKMEVIPTDLSRFIQTKVEGNPFYLEEAINALIESETLIRDNGNWKLTRKISEGVIPSTVQGVITARLDRLEKDTKRILQEASVIGRAFLCEILKRITDFKDLVDKSLNGLERLDFIRTRTLQPDLEYIFKHALTQEVVYNGLLKKERQALHERIGLVIEQLFRERLPEFYETLAYHYKLGRSPLKAVDYLTKAGEKSLKRYSLDESHSYFKEAYDLLSNKPDKTMEDEKLLIDLIIKWGKTYDYRAEYVDLINLLRAHEALVMSHAGKEQLVMFYGWLGSALSRREIPVDAYRYLRKAQQIAEEIGDIKASGYICARLTQTCADMGLLDEAVIYGERAREAANLFKSDQELFRAAFFYSAHTYLSRGEVKKIAELGQALLDYGTKYSDDRCIGCYYFAMGESRHAAGDIPSAIEFYKQAIKVSPVPVMSLPAKMLLGICYLSIGQLEEAQSTLQEVIEHCEKFGYEFAGSLAQASKGMVLIAQGDLKKGMSLYENVNKTLLENQILYRYAFGNYMMGIVYSSIALGRREKRGFSFLVKNIGFLIKTMPFAHKKAEENLNIAIKEAKKIGAKCVLGVAYLGLGQLHKAKGKKENARDCLSNAIDAFEKCEADVYLKQAREALASL
jgi:class 3 adenylate cyclase/tetratricopeptide (TPR) repeat protein